MERVAPRTIGCITKKIRHVGYLRKTRRQIKLIDAIKWLMQECDVSAEVALVALAHNRGNVFIAAELLSDGLIRQLYMREVREFSD